MKKKAYIAELLKACAEKDQRILELEAWQKGIIYMLIHNRNYLFLLVKKAKFLAGLSGSILAIDEWDYKKNTPTYKKGESHARRN